MSKSLPQFIEQLLQDESSFKLYEDCELLNWFDNGEQITLRLKDENGSSITFNSQWLVVANSWFNVQKKLGVNYLRNKDHGLTLEEKTVGRIIFTGLALHPQHFVPLQGDLNHLRRQLTESSIT